MVALIDTVSNVTARPRHPEKARLPDTPAVPKPHWIRVKTFGSYRRLAEDKGFLLVASSPLTRSSYHAAEDFARLKAARQAAVRA